MRLSGHVFGYFQRKTNAKRHRCIATTHVINEKAILVVGMKESLFLHVLHQTTTTISNRNTPIRRKASARAPFSGCSSTANAHSETRQMAVCCQNLTLGAFISHSALSVLVGALFKKFGLFLNTPCIPLFKYLLSIKPICLQNIWNIILVIKPTRSTNFSNLFLEQDSTCFGQFSTRSPFVTLLSRRAQYGR